MRDVTLVPAFSAIAAPPIGPGVTARRRRVLITSGFDALDGP